MNEMRLVHSDGLPLNCQWCHRYVKRDDLKEYQAKAYHSFCFQQLREMAQSLGREL